MSKVYFGLCKNEGIDAREEDGRKEEGRATLGHRDKI